MKSTIALLSLFLTGAASVTWAQSHPVVIELFTSQGCSSCPPADALLVELTDREDVIPLALHVDYWDYIGWADEFGDPAFSKRQKSYARVGGRKMVYTPQMIVNGTDDLVGAHAMELADMVARHRESPVRIDLETALQDGVLKISARPVNGGPDNEIRIHVVRFTPFHRSSITRGENAGLEIDYVNIVDGWTELGHWDGQSPLDMEAGIEGDRPAVVLLQEPGPGAILAASVVP